MAVLEVIQMDPVITSAIIESLIGGFFAVMVSSIAFILYFEARKEKKILELIQKQIDDEEMRYHNEVKDTLHNESRHLDHV